MGRTKKDLLSGLDPEVIVKSRFIANNTIRYTRTDGAEVIRLHDTDILIKKDDVITLDSGGWRTVTTKARLNDFLPQMMDVEPWYISQRSGEWYLSRGRYFPGTREASVLLFFDGIQIDARDGGIINYDFDEQAKKQVERKALTKKINAYCRAIGKLEELPQPSNGDCWYCLFQWNKHFDASATNNEHLYSHLDETYIHGSIILNALEFAGYRSPGFIFQISEKPHTSITSAVRKYLKAKLGLTQPGGSANESKI